MREVDLGEDLLPRHREVFRLDVRVPTLFGALAVKAAAATDPRARDQSRHPQGPLPVPYALDVAARVEEIDRSGWFGPVRNERFVWSRHNSTGEVRAQFASFSPWLALPPVRREAALDALSRLVDDEFGGVVGRLYLTPIYLAQRH